MIKSILLFICILAMFLGIGCSGRVNVSGHVTFSDGEPLNFGEVCFTEGQKTFSGWVKENGYYSPGEFKDGDGIPPGTYQVWISRTILAEPIYNKNGAEGDEVKRTDRVDQKYTAPETSGLIFEVKSGGSKTFDFTVERPPSKTQNNPQR